MIKKIKRIILAVISAVFLIFLILKILPDEKKNLIKDINNLKNAVERENLMVVLNYLDNNYFDTYKLDFDNLRSTIKEFFNAADSINIMISELKVWIDSVTDKDMIYAHCSLGLRVIAKFENEKVLVFGGIIQPASVKGYFRKQKGNYKIYSAEY